MKTLPLIILGGGDRQPGALPASGRSVRPLAGVKGVDLRIAGRRLIDVLIARYREARCFDPIYVAGPAEAYHKEPTDAELVDTDAGFGRNIGAGVAVVEERHPGLPVAFSTCDILPELDELEPMLADYRSSRPTDLWFPLIRAPEDPAQLGPSAWKPRYTVSPDEGPESGAKTKILPSHLVILDPEVMRQDLVLELCDGAYRTRNRPLLYRRSYLLRQLLFGLLLQDLRSLFTLRLPHVTWDVVRYGYVAARRLRDGIATQGELEAALRKIFVHRSHRLSHPERRIRLPILDGLSLARDIDTLEEASALHASVAASPA